MSPRQEEGRALEGERGLVPEGSLYLTVNVCPAKPQLTEPEEEDPNRLDGPKTVPVFQASPSLVLFRLFLMLYSAGKWLDILRTTGESRELLRHQDDEKQCSLQDDELLD